MMEIREDCPAFIREIAHGVSAYFEYATEFGAFENDEDDQVAELLLMLYRGANFTEAVHLLKLVFSTMKCEAACALLSLIHDDNGEKRECETGKGTVALQCRADPHRIQPCLRESQRRTAVGNVANTRLIACILHRLYCQ